MIPLLGWPSSSVMGFQIQTTANEWVSFCRPSVDFFFFLNKRRVRYLDPPVELTIIQAHKLIFSCYPVFATHKKACFFFFFCALVLLWCVWVRVFCFMPGIRWASRVLIAVLPSSASFLTVLILPYYLWHLLFLQWLKAFKKEKWDSRRVLNI